MIERHDDTVVAEHYTHTGWITTTTVETIRFDRPGSLEFLLVRGPVPHVFERFELRDADGGTELGYTGELGTDLWALGRWWGRAVAKRWEATVQHSLASIQSEAERRAH